MDDLGVPLFQETPISYVLEINCFQISYHIISMDGDLISGFVERRSAPEIHGFVMLLSSYLCHVCRYVHYIHIYIYILDNII